MPLYDFKCKKCGQKFIKLVSVVHEDVRCPKCRSKAEKIIDGTNIAIKGETLT